jgi:hypothetical protein
VPHIVQTRPRSIRVTSQSEFPAQPSERQAKGMRDPAAQRHTKNGVASRPARNASRCSRYSFRAAQVVA